MDDASETLKFLLLLHNLGSNTLQAGLVEPEENTPYDFEISQRFDSDGSRVKELVLPSRMEILELLSRVDAEMKK